MAVAFKNLAQLLSELDPDNSDASSTSRRRRRRGSENEDFDVSGDVSGMTRLLLINRATAMLRSMHTDIADLRRRLLMGGGGEDKVRRIHEHMSYTHRLPRYHVTHTISFTSHILVCLFASIEICNRVFM